MNLKNQIFILAILAVIILGSCAGSKNIISTQFLKDEALKSIAYINVKKLPGHKSSYYKTIHNAYDKHKDILLKQIEYINPDIIIGGSTLGLFINDLGLSRKDIVNHRGLNYFLKDNKIFIEAYHPAQRPSSTGVTPQMYCDSIITAVQNWATNNS